MNTRIVKSGGRGVHGPRIKSGVTAVSRAGAGGRRHAGLDPASMNTGLV
jgi:hypothetical protein